MPRVSVVMTTFNRADLIEESIGSVKAQTEEDWELIVVDDCSTDDTRPLMERHCRADRRVKFIRQQVNQGAQVARNLGLSVCTGEYVNIFDSDDLFEPTKFEVQIATLKKFPDHGLAVCQMGNFEKVPGDMDTLWNTFAGDEPLMRFLRHDPPWGIHAPLWRRQALLEVGPFDPEIPVAQDFEYHARALCLGVRPVLQPDLLCYCRAHEGSSFRRMKSITRFATLLRIFRKLHKILLSKDALTPPYLGELAKSSLWVSLYSARFGDVATCRDAQEQFRVWSGKPVSPKASMLSLLLAMTKRDRFFRALRSAYEAQVGSLDDRDTWSGKHKVQDEPGLVA